MDLSSSLLTETGTKPATLLVPFAAALGLTDAVVGPGHLLLHLTPKTDLALGAVIFAVSAVSLLAIRCLKMDTSYTL